MIYTMFDPSEVLVMKMIKMISCLVKQRAPNQVFCAGNEFEKRNCDLVL